MGEVVSKPQAPLGALHRSQRERPQRRTIRRGLRRYRRPGHPRRSFQEIVSGIRGLSFTRRQASPTGWTNDRPVAGYPAARDIGLAPWKIPPTPRAVGGAQRSQRERPPTANYSPRITAPPAALEFVVTISGTGVRASVAYPEQMPVPAKKSRRPPLSAGLVHCLGGLAGVKTRLAADVCDRRPRLW